MPTSITGPRSGARHYYSCPVCGNGGGSANFAWRKGRWLVGCYSCEADGLVGGGYLRALAAEVGATAPELLTDPGRWLAGRRVESGAAGRGPGRRTLPTPGEVDEWSQWLLASDQPLTYLRDERGLGLDVIEAARLGWDGERLIFPMFGPAGEVATAKWRLPRSGAQMVCWPGRGRDWPLYPGVAREEGWTLVTAGELDALRARSAGLPAVSVTLGAGTWREEWTEDLRGLRVVLCFDVGEQWPARRWVRELRAAGVHARRLDLRRLRPEIHEHGTDLSDYLNGEGEAAEVAAASKRSPARRRRRKALDRAAGAS